MVDRCVHFFTSHGEFEKAIDLLVKVGKVHHIILLTGMTDEVNAKLFHFNSLFTRGGILELSDYLNGIHCCDSLRLLVNKIVIACLLQ